MRAGQASFCGVHRKLCLVSAEQQNLLVVTFRYLQSQNLSCVQDLKWSQTRQQETLQAMLREEFAMIDDQGPGNQRLYWFPCLADFSAAASVMAAA